MYFPGASITHLGGQSVGKAPTRFALETYRSRYRYFYKHFGRDSLGRLRHISLLHLWVRYCGYSLKQAWKPTDTVNRRLSIYKTLMEWNRKLDPVRFIEDGEEPNVGFTPLAPPPRMVK